MSLNKDGVFALVDRERDPILYDELMRRWKEVFADAQMDEDHYNAHLTAHDLDVIIQQLTGLENPYFEEEDVVY